MESSTFQARLAEIEKAARKRYSAQQKEWRGHESLRGSERVKADAEARAETRKSLIPVRDSLALERVIGDADFFHVNYFEQAQRAARAVGKVHVIDQFGIPDSFGTGLMVAPSLMLTNNHVLQSEGWAIRSFIEFDFEYDIQYRPKKTTLFAFDPDVLFFTHPDLDFTLVAVQAISSDDVALTDFGTLPLIPDSGKALIGEPVTIIQHPKGGLKQVALRNSTILGIPDAPGDGFIHYSTDTEPGSSGSPVLNDQWQVVALHHAGVPGPSGGWVANEGVRVSRIFNTLEVQAHDGNEDAQRALAQLQTPNPLAGSIVPATDTSLGVTTAGGEAEAASYNEERWRSVKGYDRFFLGDDTEVPLPLPVDRHDVTVTRNGDHELTYHHFSVVMSKSRRLAYVAAVNIDGSRMRDTERDDNWRLDSRLPAALQIDNRCYKHNDLDRGHLVRRISPGWGSARTARKAEEDTFHYTNCAPQHKNLNQRTWLDLEDYIIELTDEENTRASVFTGPVFRPDDMLYRNEYRIPAEFWKVAAMLNEDGELVAAGYLQTQKNLLPDVREAFGDYKTYRVPVTTIAELTGLDFGPLVPADSASRREATRAVHEVTGPDDLDFV